VLRCEDDGAGVVALLACNCNEHALILRRAVVAYMLDAKRDWIMFFGSPSQNASALLRARPASSLTLGRRATSTRGSCFRWCSGAVGSGNNSGRPLRARPRSVSCGAVARDLAAQGVRNGGCSGANEACATDQGRAHHPAGERGTAISTAFTCSLSGGANELVPRAPALAQPNVPRGLREVARMLTHCRITIHKNNLFSFLKKVYSCSSEERRIAGVVTWQL
jgi:hypothetical protein